MVCLLPLDQEKIMAKSQNSTDPCMKLGKINQMQKKKNMLNSKNQLSIPACEKSRSALIDVMILIAVIGACGVLLYPSVNLLVNKIPEILRTISSEVKEEIYEAPVVYICLGLSILFAGIALLAVTVCTGRRCGKPGCRGLKKAAEFDIQLESEDCVKNSAKDGVNKKGLFELPRDHHRELEAELKRMAPPNGRAVLIFRGRCGCSVGTMEVPGPKKTRKVKK
ncbi:uncharacterized protein At5g19025-like [Nicotiana tomentosiformis]|uniref:Uncharacterized protein At5g19025-like n=1 Tax=Nicotiana tabacum TaxID=4097 RepID=A0A1S3Z3H5_TOBAC|nr:uncharacterized protein At5g19025-like [Nicotiana tomentosiformis]XP_016458918.1 PREDICTED: uncharacterized protein At5g19025-like [Nicotiana tabacum]